MKSRKFLRELFLLKMEDESWVGLSTFIVFVC